MDLSNLMLYMLAECVESRFNLLEMTAAYQGCIWFTSIWAILIGMGPYMMYIKPA